MSNDSKEPNGLHVKFVLLKDTVDPSITGVQVHIWPLPDDAAIHREITSAIDGAVKAILIKNNLIEDEPPTVLSARGNLCQ